MKRQMPDGSYKDVGRSATGRRGRALKMNAYVGRGGKANGRRAARRSVAL